MKTYSDYGLTVPSGTGEYAMVCPQCSHDRKKKQVKCLSVNRDKQVFNCLHCGWSGGLSGFGYIPPKVYRKPTVKLSSIPKKVQDFFEKRKIPLEILEKNKISGGRYYFPQTGKEEDAILFPYFRDGEIINCKYRGSEKKFGLEKDAERIIYGLDFIKGADEVIFCEGEIDALSFQTAGLVAVSVPNGANTNLDYLDNDYELLSQVKTWIIAVDNDEAGRKLEKELARRLGIEKCKRVNFSDKIKDGNQLLQEHGVEALKCVVNDATAFPIAGIFTARDFENELKLLLREGLQAGCSTGWNNLDNYYTIQQGEMTIVTGFPGSGKSNFIDALMVNLATNEDWRFALFSPENQPIADHVSRMIEKRLLKPFRTLTDADVTNGSYWVNEHFSWILPDDDSEWTISNILDLAKKKVIQRGVKGVVIDPFNEMEHYRPNGMTETEYIGMELKRIRQFARRNDVHVWVIAHPTKPARNKDGEVIKCTPYSVSGSANWCNKSDNFLSVWRNFKESTDPIEVSVQKIRFKQTGRIGETKFDYIHDTATYKPNSNNTWADDE